MLAIAQIQAIRNDLGRLLGKVRLTDGEHDSPAMDAPSRSAWVRISRNAPGGEGELNPSMSLSWTDGALTGIDMTIGAATYRRTLTWTDGALTAVSEWSEV